MSADIAAVTLLRAQLWQSGLRPVPVLNAKLGDKTSGKAPLGRQWQIEALKDPPYCIDHPVAHALNTGILCNGLRAIDFDIDDDVLLMRCHQIAIDMLPPGALIRRRAGSARCMMVYRAAEGEPPNATPITGVTHGQAGKSCKLEVLGRGHQFVAFGTHWEALAELEWPNGAPGEVRRDELPEVTEKQIHDFLAACAPIIDAPPPRYTNGKDRDQEHTPGEAQAAPLRVAAALHTIGNTGPPNWDRWWNYIGMAVWRATGGSELGWEAWNAWSAGNAAYNADAARERWDHYFTSPPDQLGAGTIIWLARKAKEARARAALGDPPPAEQWWYEEEGEGERPAGDEPQAADDADDLVGIVSEGAIADAFGRQHRARLRFDHHAGKWFLWDGIRWRREETKLAYRWAHQKARVIAADKEKAAVIVSAGKAAFAAGVERIAQSDRAFAVTSEIWDADPWLLGTPGGTVDLRTGEFRPAAREDYITKLTAVAPADAVDCPQWLAFLHQTFAGDAGLIRFLQQWHGYSLTGSTREHALLFGHGHGGNGKTVLLNTISNIMGDYCRTAAMDTFTAAKHDRHPTELAALVGARMVCASETEEGRAWSEVRIKQLTGGDRIAARHMRQDFFEFTPQFKLIVIGNNVPELHNVDDAARRRLNIVPFTQKPPVIDRNLEQKLRAEWPGILRWAIVGCLDWQKNGLIRPDAVAASTAEYFNEQDLLGQWIEERCVQTDDDGGQAKDTVASLMASWRNYAKAHGEDVWSSRRFVTSMRKRGFRPIRDVAGLRGRGLLGVRVRTQFYGGARDDG